MSWACLSKALFAYGRMLKHPQTILFLCFVLSLACCFYFYIAFNVSDRLHFWYASLSHLKIFKMYYRGNPIVNCPTYIFCKLSFLAIVSLQWCFQCFSCSLTFYKTIFFKTWREATSYSEIACNFRISYGWLAGRVRASVVQLSAPYSKGCDCDKWYQCFVSSLAKWEAIMSTTKQLSKSKFELLTEIKKQFLYLRELPDKVRFLQTRLDGLDEKVEGLDALNVQIDKLPTNELTLRVDSIEHKATQVGGFKRLK